MGLLTDYYGNLGKLVAAPEPRVPTRDSQNALGRKAFNPNKASIAETLLSFSPVLGDVLSAKDTAASLSEGNYGEAALNGVGLLPFVPSLAKVPMVAGAIKAFHGTPHTFKPEPGLPFGRFKKEAIGSGEGAAAYGHGASYSAEASDVAQSYQEGIKRFELNGKVVNPTMGGTAEELAAAALKRFPNKTEAINWIGNDFPTMGKQAKQIIKNAKKYGDTKGHLLELSHEWPDAAKEARTPLSKDDLLDWDKPLSEQPHFTSIKNAATQNNAPERLRIWEKNGTLDSISGSQFYKRLGEYMGSDRAASEYLHSLGIPGIKYLDGTSRGAGEGTHNFVMFEPEYTKIVARDGIPAKGLLSE